jgi:hypothetical protein
MSEPKLDSLVERILDALDQPEAFKLWQDGKAAVALTNFVLPIIQSDFDRELALRVGIALGAAEKILNDKIACLEPAINSEAVYRIANYSMIAQAIHAIPRDASLVEQHDAEIRKPYELALEKFRSILADGVTAIKKVLDGRDWLGESRGPYEWDDDRWMKEFGAAVEEISTALKPLETEAADLSMCPTNWADVVKARTDTTSKEKVDAELALREAAWREAVCRVLEEVSDFSIPPDTCINADQEEGYHDGVCNFFNKAHHRLRALPSSTELLAQREKDAGARAYDSVIHMLQSMQICCVPNQVDRGAVISQVRLMRDDLLKESIGGVTYSPPVPPRSTDVAAPSGYSEKIQRDED